MREKESLNSRLSLICSHKVTVPSGYMGEGGGGKGEDGRWRQNIFQHILTCRLITVSFQADTSSVLN